MTTWLATILSVFIVSAVSLVGLATLGLKHKTLHTLSLALVSLAAGSLLGDAFIHLIPEAYEHTGAGSHTALFILSGIVLFFIVEKFIHWRHCHDDTECHVHKKHLAPMNIVGDLVHNVIDGMLIAASFSVSMTAGIATTVAVIMHEIPQEIRPAE